MPQVTLLLYGGVRPSNTGAACSVPAIWRSEQHILNAAESCIAHKAGKKGTIVIWFGGCWVAPSLALVGWTGLYLMRWCIWCRLAGRDEASSGNSRSQRTCRQA